MHTQVNTENKCMHIYAHHKCSVYMLVFWRVAFTCEEQKVKHVMSHQGSELTF